MKQGMWGAVWARAGAWALVGAVAGAGLLGGGCSKGLDEATRQELLGEIDAALKDGEAREAQRKAAVAKILAQGKLETKRCDGVVLVEEDGTLRASNDEQPSVSTPTALFADEFNALQDKAGRRITRLRADLGLLRSQVEGHPEAGAKPITPDTVAWARERIASRGSSWFPYEVHFALHNLQRDIVDPKTGHRSPSHAEARAFVWDYVHGTVVCQADFQKTLRAGDTINIVYDKRHGPRKSDADLAWDWSLVNDVEEGAFAAMGLGTPRR